MECLPPVSIDNSLISGNQLSVGSAWMYQCFDGYHFLKNVYEMETFCQENGVWRPRPGVDFNCTGNKLSSELTGIYM